VARRIPVRGDKVREAALRPVPVAPPGPNRPSDKTRARPADDQAESDEGQGRQPPAGGDPAGMSEHTA